MRKIKEALRLKAAGLGNREIAASIGAGKTHRLRDFGSRRGGWDLLAAS